MTEHDFPEITSAVLRDNATPERVERIWKRLDGDLTTRPRPARNVLWLAPAALTVVFALGVFVGSRWVPVEPAAPTVLGPEPATRAEPGRGALPGQVREERAPQPRRTARVPNTRAEVRSEELELEPEPAPLGLEPPPAPEPIHVAPPPVFELPAWQRLFDQGEFDAARRELSRHNGFAFGFDSALAAAGPEQAVNLADLAVQSGHRNRAVQALRRVVDSYGSHPVAPLAAYKLGNLLEKIGDRAGAAEAFASYRRLSPTGDLAEDALARQVDVAIERGDLERARQLADQYAKDFPNGRRLSDIRERVQKLGGASGTDSADAGAPSNEELPAEEPQDDLGDRTE